METETKPAIRPLEQLIQLNPLTLIHIGEIDAGNISQLHRIASTTYGILKALEDEPNTENVINVCRELLDHTLKHLTKSYFNYIGKEITQNDLIAYKKYLLKYFPEFECNPILPDVLS